MKDEVILSHIDHTLLKATAAWPEIEKLCEEALRYHTASVCVPPSYVKRIRERFPALNVCTVIGFPLGYSAAGIKAAEAAQAAADGAGEIDMVVNLGDVKNGDFDKVTDEIRAVRAAAGDRILKVIIETCYLTEDEKAGLCRSVTEGGADYIKTSTGFGTAGAKIEDIRLFKKHIGPKVKIKAAGGVKTREDLELFLGEGCDRIGTSSAVVMLKGATSEAY
ncbi:MAG: deoxyribose-phosphate aldolase [Spirochaetaceae bacterium]|jgi:deoxyribose-phosphate aldolase|nr:deoxyribose-phosphate aldolase [Spirochaetaceae bacterium]